jgi:hypothetical protein
VIYLPPVQALFGTAPLPLWTLASLVPMPLLVWGVDELYGRSAGTERRGRPRRASGLDRAEGTGAPRPDDRHTRALGPCR